MVDLDDTNLRAVSLLSLTGSTAVLVNSRYRWGPADSVQRFTLAHELAHLLLDQDRAGDIVVASGPWAPVEVEQRANAFAAALLMPLPLINGAAARLTEPLVTRTAVLQIATELKVSLSAVISRLQNLGYLGADEADALRSGAAEPRSSTPTGT